MNCNVNKEKLIYILKFFDEYLWKSIDDIVHDSEEDPHFSAVAATNIFKCYAQIMNELGEPLLHDNIREYMLFEAFTEEEYNIFESHRQKETTYYRGIQY